MEDMKKIRAAFPMLTNNPAMVYLDSASTALTPDTVIAAVTDYYTNHNTNTSRGVDKYGYETTKRYEAVRSQVRAFINATEREEIIFTRGATASLNMIAFGFAASLLKPNDEIILNIAEHHANLLPWREVCRRTGAVIKYVDLRADGSIDLTHLTSLLSEKTRIVAFADVSNVLGSYNNTQEIVRLVRAHSSAYVVVDGAQGVTQHAVDVQATDCDFYVFSGHKLCGPTGVGVLYGKKVLLEAMLPFEFGGDMIASVNKTKMEYKELPHKLEAGTMMIAEVFGLGAALEFYTAFDRSVVATHIKKLRTLAIAELKVHVPDIVLYNETLVDARTITFNVGGIHAHDVATVFSENDVVVRAGHHCAQLLLEKLQTTSTVRMSIGMHNTEADIARFIAVAKKAGNFLDALFG